jgi:hypothetical protein
MNDVKTENLAFFFATLPELLQNPLLRHKFVVVHERTVKAAYDTFAAALRHAVATFPPGEFIIQQVIDDREVIGFLRAAG